MSTAPMNAFAARTGGLMRRPDVAQTNAANWNRPGGGYDQWKQGDAARNAAQPIGTMLPQAPIQGQPIGPSPLQPGALGVPPIQPIGVAQPQQPMNAMAPLAQNGMGPVQQPPIQPVGPQLPGGMDGNLNALRARLAGMQ